MRTLELVGVVCNGCGVPPPQQRWGRRCSDCRGGSFRIEIDRSSEGWDFDGVFTRGIGAGDLAFLLDAATDDLGGPGPFFRTRARLACAAVSAEEIAAFREAGLEARIRRYVAWKRGEVEASLPADHRVCARCRVAFKVYDNEWARSGFCSRACRHAFLKSSGGASSAPG